MLTLVVLSEGLIDLDVNGLAAPFEFLAAAARARRIQVESHESLLYPGVSAGIRRRNKSEPEA
jgi:hypothetical protein